MKIVIRINIVAFLYTLNPEHFLLLKRSQNRGGFWQPVSGGVEKCEQPIQSVKREIFEETGIKDIIRIVDLDSSYDYECMKNNVKMRMKDICYGVELDKIEPVILSEEHSMFKWCKKDKVRDYLNWKEILVSFEKLNKIINL